PGTSSIQRHHRSLFEGEGRPARGCERSGGPILGRPGERALARAARRGAPRPHRSRRMVPPLKGGSLIPHRRYARAVTTGPGQRTKETTMTNKLVALALLCLMGGTAAAEGPKVTPLMTKDLPEAPGKEALMITVEHAPGESTAIHRHNAHAFVYVLEG